MDLSGLTEDEARAELQRAYGSLSDGRLVLTGAAGEHVISYAEVGRGPDLDAMLAEAIAVGRAGTTVDRAVADARTAVRGVFLEPRVTFDAARLAERVTAIADSLRTEPTDARVDTTSSGQFQVVEGSAGRAADPAAVIAAFATALGELDAPAEVSAELRLSTVDPAVTTADATEARAQAERLTAPIALVVGDERLTIDGAELRTLGDLRDDRRWHVRADPGRDAAHEARRRARAEGRPAAGQRDLHGHRRQGHRDHPQQGRLQARRSGHRGADPGTAGGTSRASRRPRSCRRWPSRRPTLTTAQAEAAASQMQKISEWTTYFPISDRNGFGANIWIPALTIDGYVVGPHETFDFWDAIGPVTREKGYVDGGAIINGKTEPQGALAGGICSCSTTLFNAALRAGFKMGARANHYYYIDRYPLGLDATVFISASGSIQTMSWTNDTDYPVLIRGYKIRNGTRGLRQVRAVQRPDRSHGRDRPADGQEHQAGHGHDAVDDQPSPGALASESSSRSTASRSGARSRSTTPPATSSARRPTTRTTRGSPASRWSAPGRPPRLRPRNRRPPPDAASQTRTSREPMTQPIDPVSSPDAYRTSILAALGDDDPAEAQAAAVGRVRDLVADAGGLIDQRPEPDEWSVLECIGHAVDAELVVSARYRWILAEDQPPLVGYDQALWVSGLAHGTDDPRLLLELFAALRRSNLDLWARRPVEDRARVGLHQERGPESYELTFRLAAGHDRVHLGQARRALEQVRGR